MWWLSCIISNIVLASLLGLAAWFIQKQLRWHGLARVLWLLALLKLITPPLIVVPVGNAPSMVACAIGTCGCEQHARIPIVLGGALPWLLVATWSVGAATMAWTAWRRWSRFRWLLSHATVAPAQWRSLVARLASELSLRRPPQILAVPGQLPPLVVPGWRGPRILVPVDLMRQLDDSQRAVLILHELAHIRRGDHLVRMLEFIVGLAYWWLPFSGAIGRQLRTCEEACCDAVVVAHLPQARRAYARLLLDVLDFAQPLPRQSVPQVTAMSTASDLEQRIGNILEAPQAARPLWPGAVAVCLALAILPCQLQYDLVGRSAPSTTSHPTQAAAGAQAAPLGGGERETAFVGCCPS